MEERKGAHRVLVGKPGGKRPLGRPRRDGRGWIDLAQNRDRLALVNAVMNLRFP
jgi:hypothetical protein